MSLENLQVCILSSTWNLLITGIALLLPFQSLLRVDLMNIQCLKGGKCRSGAFHQ